MQAVATEAAEAIVETMIEATGATLPVDVRARIVSAIESGRCDLNAGEMTATVYLSRPIKTAKTTINELTVHEPTAGQIRDSAKPGRSELDQSLFLLAAVSDLSILAIEQLGARDLRVSSEVMSFFV